MACFPSLAAAEENSGIQYETDVPSVPKDEGSNIPSKKHPGGSNTSNEADNEATGSNTPGGAGSGGGDNSSTGGGTGTGQGSPGSGGGGDKAANGSQAAGGDVSGAQPIETVPAASKQAADDGGSSPLVPILIAVAVLAAISIGAFYYRQRRQGSGSTVSPSAN